MEFSKEFKVISPTAEEIIAVMALQEIDSEFLSDRELWILQEFGGDY